MSCNLFFCNQHCLFVNLYRPPPLTVLKVDPHSCACDPPLRQDDEQNQRLSMYMHDLYVLHCHGADNFQFVGQIIHHASKGKFLQYQEQSPSFVIPKKYLLASLPSPSARRSSRVAQLRADTIQSEASSTTTAFDRSGQSSPQGKEHNASEGKKPRSVGYEGEPVIVDWYGPDDPENPLNWYVIFSPLFARD